MFKHGNPVILTDASGRETSGTLHFPPVTFTGHTRNGAALTQEERTDTGAYAVHTIILEDGHRFRTEGRLQHARDIS